MGHISMSWSVKERDLNSGGLLLYSLRVTILTLLPVCEFIGFIRPQHLKELSADLPTETAQATTGTIR